MIERRRMPRIIERGTHYPVIRSAASGAIGNSLPCLVGAVFNGWVANESALGAFENGGQRQRRRYRNNDQGVERRRRRRLLWRNALTSETAS